MKMLKALALGGLVVVIVGLSPVWLTSMFEAAYDLSTYVVDMEPPKTPEPILRPLRTSEELVVDDQAIYLMQQAGGIDFLRQ